MMIRSIEHPFAPKDDYWSIECDGCKKTRKIKKWRNDLDKVIKKLKAIRWHFDDGKVLCQDCQEKAV